MSPTFSVAARMPDGAISLWQVNTCDTHEAAAQAIATAIKDENKGQAPRVVLVGITGGK